MDFSENALDTAGNNDKSENHENVILGEYYEIKLGMQVSSEEEAYTCSFNILFTVQLQLRLCLVAVKRFPEKENVSMVFGCISKNFPENIFWCLEKKKENTNQKNTSHKSRKTQIQNNTSKLRLVHSNIFTENASNQAKETKTQQKKMNQ